MNKGGLFKKETATGVAAERDGVNKDTIPACIGIEVFNQ
jgi:hypothetical protein